MVNIAKLIEKRYIMFMKGWNIDKHIPLAMILTLVLQTVGVISTGIWYASKFDSRVANLETVTNAQTTALESQSNLLARVDERVKVIYESR